MKLARIGDAAREAPCILGEDGRYRDVSALVPDFGPASLGEDLLELLRDADLGAFPLVEPAGQRFGPPVALPRNIWCIGLNYVDHAKEARLPIPEEPILFNKSSATWSGPNDPIPFTPTMTKLDWEVELGVVIGKSALDVSEEDALTHVFGYCVINDVSERAWQQERGGQWVKGKSYPGFCPAGPLLVTADEIPDPQDLSLWLDVNGEAAQRGTTESMIFSVKKIISYMSEFARLEPGDIILTGTPPGVGAGMKPPRFLQPGDTVSLGVAGMGTQTQSVVATEART